MKISINKTTKNYSKGFGLLEVVLAAGILVIVIGATVALGNVAIKNSVISQDRTQAYNLAQEGLEIVRNVRDNAWIDSDPNTTFASVLTNGGPYELVLNNGKWALSPTGGDGEKIILGKTEYKRIVNIESPGGQVDGLLRNTYNIDNTENGLLEKRIEVTVEWQEYGVLWQVKSSTLLSDWRPAF